LVDTLRTLTSSLRGGLSIEQAIYNVAETSPSPTKEEFEKVAIDLNYGKGFNESMQALQQRINDSDMDLITTVIFIQKDIGGNLTENLDIIADTIEERIKLKNDLKALTANGRLSALIIGNVPLGLFVLLNLVDASYFDSFFSNSLGMALFGLAIFLDIIGVLVSMKLATPEINEI
jgi:tight adherence protein B